MASSKRDKLAALAEYKRTRQGGKRQLKEENVQIYDEVTEDQYNGIVKGRLQEDDFVVDDGVGGYVDNGQDDWIGDGEGHDSDEEPRTKSKAHKNTKRERQKPRPKPRAPSPTPATDINAYRPKVSAEDEDDLMKSILGTMDSAPASASVITSKVSRKRKPVITDDYSDESSPIRPEIRSSYQRPAYDDTSSDGPQDDGFLAPSSDDIYFSPTKKARVTPSGGSTPTMLPVADLTFSDHDPLSDTAFDDDMVVDLSDIETKPPPIKVEPKETKLNVKPKQNASTTVDSKPSWLTVYDTLTVAEEDPLGPATSSSISPSTNTNISALEPDGSLRFFWLDYLEHEGKLHFVGKLKDKTSGAWVSCCVTVEGMQRNLFVLPRPKRVDAVGDVMNETDIIPTPQDVHGDFEMIRKEMGIKLWKGKFVKRKYAFGEKEVPRGESSWLKVVYPFSDPTIPQNACSPNIAQIFGTNTSAFELLVLKRKIMGPCWLEVKKPEVITKGVSWCKLEATVSDPKDIKPFAESRADAPRDLPPLTIASLSVKTIVNHKENTRELVCVTARIWNNMHIDDPTPPEKLPCSVYTFVRPLDRFPTNFDAQARANGKMSILPVKNERMLLSSLLATIYKADPDVIVGHEFLGVSLDVLLHRMRSLKVDHWSRIGRFRRSRWPNIGKQGTNLKFLNGRMLCDLASDGAKSMIASTTWSMTEMCKTHLRVERQDIDPDDTASYFDGRLSTPDRLLTFVRHCELDAHLQMAIASKVQILPLTRQLTNLAGNSWNKTLNGGRAERNEYILLHEFHRLKYICPDKMWGKAAIAVKQEPTEDDPQGEKTTKGKRDKYQGGLVFEPKRGLWDRFVLVMDFNSLYPSIIQEYNIDFTTVERGDDDEEKKIPEPPPSEVPQGVLPRLIATLVNRRRQVKSLMKDKKATPAQLLQYDIKQQALKLTANSMYGCLGFEYSRFFARPLAALTTFKGREILTNTKELAESLELDVVYGDTDSVFVNTNATELSEALRISAEFKKAVNDRYKLLEIDLDSIFQRLLLLQKKKYAAIKVEDGSRTSTEIKGLDMKRREYCALSKNVSQYVLNQILSGEATEDVIENIHEYLRTIGQSVRDGKIKLDEFIIFKRLGKAPEDYPDAKGLPHVQVALRMKAKGGTARSGDVIPYVFCIAAGEEPAKTAQADRAKHPDEIRKTDSGLVTDFEYYLSQQVLPPIERLCDQIEGTDRARLAECLGLDPSKYHTSVSGSNERAFSTLDSQKSDKERFKDCEPFLVQCRHCQGQVPFSPLYERETSIVQSKGLFCPACQKPISVGSLAVQLETQLRGFIGKYHESWTVCKDSTCGYRTPRTGVYGRTCLSPGCNSFVSVEFSEVELYNQLSYFSSLFNRDHALKGLPNGERDAVAAVFNLNANSLHELSQCTDKYTDQCAHRWVNLGNIFSFMKI